MSRYLKPDEAVGAEQLLTAKEVAAMLRLSVAWTLQHANGTRRPHIKSVKMGKSVRFRRSDIERFIDDCTREAA